MTSRCVVSRRVRMVGNNVSHANNKTKRLFRLNVQPFMFVSDVLGQKIRLELSIKGMRLIEKAGGIDAFLAKSKLRHLDVKLQGLKKLFDQKNSIHTQAATA